MYTTLQGYKDHIDKKVQFFSPALPSYIYNDTGMVGAEYGYMVRRKDDCGRCSAVRVLFVFFVLIENRIALPHSLSTLAPSRQRLAR